MQNELKETRNKVDGSREPSSARTVAVLMHRTASQSP